MYKSLSY